MSDEPERVRHRVSGQCGVLLGRRGRWYVSVRFDGNTYASTVARDSVEPIPATPTT